MIAENWTNVTKVHIIDFNVRFCFFIILYCCLTAFYSQGASLIRAYKDSLRLALKSTFPELQFSWKGKFWVPLLPYLFFRAFYC